MRKVAIDDLEPGMILSRDVDTQNGSRILVKGALLSETAIALLAKRRVLDVWVEDKSAVPDEAPSEEDSVDEEEAREALEAAIARLERRFEGRLVNPWMRALCEGAKERLAVPRFWREAPQA